eukprot:jgi/Ulvmu1/6302/UM029_0009.1
MMFGYSNGAMQGEPSVATAARFTSCLYHDCQTCLIAEDGGSNPLDLHGSRVIDTLSALIANHTGSCADLELSDIDASPGGAL